MSPRTYASSREQLLEAAERVLLRGGLAGFGVAAVVEEAGLTKGALFHHFKSKEDLLAALVERLAAGVDERIAAIAAEDPFPIGRTLRAQITLTFTMQGEERERLRALALALMQAVAASPSIAARVRAVNQSALARARGEGVSPGNALAVQLALDGYWLNDTAGSLSIDAGQRQLLREALNELTQPKVFSPQRKKARR